ncbi:hypothetical protein PoB_001198200 [Plakobranchus ocellatus]|uniref:Uncharacterized protein n=1 Tax=Plakobranchus ocellatus TaxID=259542 RepID=A0AAV3YTL3_9GAST|nr:hypothetical protein PoB_001198200 [Plakobranchus ocellatus]
MKLRPNFRRSGGQPTLLVYHLYEPTSSASPDIGQKRKIDLCVGSSDMSKIQLQPPGERKVGRWRVGRGVVVALISPNICRDPSHAGCVLARQQRPDLTKDQHLL